MKILIALFISFNCLAEYKMEISANVVGGVQSKIFATEAEARAKVEKIARSDGWRKCRFDEDSTDAIFSKQETVITYEDRGETTSYVDENGDMQTIDILTEIRTDTTYYCHPENWTYTITDVTAEMQAERDDETSKKDDRTQVKAMLNQINNSSKPPWEKKWMRVMMRECLR